MCTEGEIGVADSLLVEEDCMKSENEFNVEVRG